MNEVDVKPKVDVDGVPLGHGIEEDRQLLPLKIASYKLDNVRISD